MNHLVNIIIEQKHLLWAIALGVLAYFLFGDNAYAATVDIGSGHGEFTLMNQFDDVARAQGETWQKTIAALGRNTFKILATIEFTWAAAIWVFEKDSLSPLVVDMIKKIMFICFFLFILNNASEITTAIVATFRQVGGNASGFCTLSADQKTLNCSNDAMTADGVVATGFAVVDLIWDKCPTQVGEIFRKLGQIFVAILVTVIIVIAYVIAAFQLLFLNIESYVLLAAGAIFLGLGGSRWTQEYVTKYLKYALNVGVRLLVLLLILALTTTLAQRFAGGFIFAYKELFQMLILGILTAVFAVKAPEMAMALIQGGSGFSAGAFVSSAKSITGGVATVVGAPKSVIGGVVGGLQGAYHAKKLVQNSYKLAKMEGKGKGAAAKTALGLAAKEGGRSLLNAARGKGHGSHGFTVSRDKTSDKQASMGGGASKKPGALDRANREVKARMDLANKGGGGVGGE